MSDTDLIRQLLARYCFIADHGTAEELTDLFWDDAVLDSSARFQGRAEILAANQAWVEQKRDPITHLRHLTFEPLIELDGARATVRSYFYADGHLRKRKTPIQLRGIYDDVLERRDGVWKFLRRATTLHPTLLSALKD